jgi:hypothetical protein
MFDTSLYGHFLEYDSPIQYKTLTIYPVQLKDYHAFIAASFVLNIAKDEIGPEAASMSYIDFIAMLILLGQDKKLEKCFTDIAKLCFHKDIEDCFFDIKDNGHFILVVDGKEFNKKEFDEIRSIIMFQNILDYDDKYVDPELAKALEEESILRARKRGHAKFEDYVSAVAALTGYQFDYMYSLPMRRFFFLLNKAVSKFEYQIARTAEMSGMVKFDRPIKDWIPSEHTNFLQERLGEYGELKKKVSTK